MALYELLKTAVVNATVQIHSRCKVFISDSKRQTCEFDSQNQHQHNENRLNARGNIVINSIIRFLVAFHHTKNRQQVGEKENVEEKLIDGSIEPSASEFNSNRSTLC